MLVSWSSSTIVSSLADFPAAGEVEGGICGLCHLFHFRQCSTVWPCVSGSVTEITTSRKFTSKFFVQFQVWVCNELVLADDLLDLLLISDVFWIVVCHLGLPEIWLRTHAHHQSAKPKTHVDSLNMLLVGFSFVFVCQFHGAGN